jgi:hypothetical protein
MPRIRKSAFPKRAHAAPLFRRGHPEADLKAPSPPLRPAETSNRGTTHDRKKIQQKVAETHKKNKKKAKKDVTWRSSACSPWTELRAERDGERGRSGVDTTGSPLPFLLLAQPVRRPKH